MKLINNIKGIVLLLVALLAFNSSFAQTWADDIIAAKKSFKERVTAQMPVKDVNAIANEISNSLAEKYGSSQLVFLTMVKMGAPAWLATTGTEAEAKAVQNAVNRLLSSAYFQKQVDAVSGSDEEKITAYINIVEKIMPILDLQEKLIWIDAENVKAAFNDFKNSKGYDAAKYQAKLSELERACKIGYDGIYSENCDAIANAKQILALSNEILMSNPALDFDKIIVGKYYLGNKARTSMAPALGTQSNNWTNQMSAARRGLDGEIAEISDIRGEKEFRTIFKPADKVAVTDIQLHWDADRILFTSINDMGLWDMFEVNRDGTNVHQVIDVNEDDLEFIDGAFLPDGRYMAITNLGYHGVPCVNGNDVVGNLAIYDPKTKSLRRTTFDQDANWHPVVMNNGRLMYVRWEYTDLTHYYSRIVMHSNPDGTETRALYGSGKFFPNSIYDVKPIPGGDSKFISIISGHHGVARSGRMMLFDPAKGRTGTKGLVQEFPYSKRHVVPFTKDQLVDGVWPQFIKPYPINEKYYLVSVKLTPTSLWSIYLVDIFDNMTLVMEAEDYGFISPTVVEKRDTPPIIPDKVDLTKSDATVFIQDIYEGEGLPNVPRGTVKKIRVFNYEYAYIKSPSNHEAQGVQSGWDIKRLIGEVDVEEDGSAIFKVPANVPISLQPLDSEGRALQWMRSWFTAMPGETVSCIGCHEDQNKIVPPKRVAASTKAPAELTLAEGGPRPFTFPLEIQPILNRACIACHKEGSSVDLRGPLKTVISNEDRDLVDERGYSFSYLAIHPFVSRQGSEADALVMKPYEYHASTSELVKILKNGHHGVELTDAEWRKLYAWIDMNAPYRSSFEQNDLKGYNQIQRRQELAKKYNNLEIDWVQEIEDYTKLLNSQPQPEPVMPKKVETNYKSAKAKAWPFDAATAKSMQDELGETTLELTIAENVVIKLRKIPAGSFVMGSNKYGRNTAPEAKVKIEKDFWMGEIEITNRQFGIVFPEHDSRFVAQLWKDHTTPGYPANEPNMPVTRVSWDEAMEFCAKVSEMTGMKVTLPTEAQWEWACRGGTDGDNWYGNSNTDFAPYENLADKQLENMAVSGVDPKPMARDNANFKYYNYFPKVASVDDGSMLLVDGAKYKANPWGLYDMHGNVKEWTSSSYLTYPYNAKSKETSTTKSIKGGSWFSRPKEAFSAYRTGYYQWQKAKDVGFRIIVEE